MTTVGVTFRVNLTIPHRQYVALTGDDDALGNWKLEQIICMDEVDSGCWSCTVPLCTGSIVHYRYLVCMYGDEVLGQDDKCGSRAVLEWETHPRARKLHVVDGTSTAMDDYGVISGDRRVDKGWLTDQTEIIIKLHNNPVHLLKRSLHERTLRIKCGPVDLSISESASSGIDDEDSLHYDRRLANHDFPVYVSALRSVEECRPRDQSQFGETYNNGDFLIFRTQTFKPDTTGLKFDIYVDSRTPDEEPRYLGNAFHLPQRSSNPSSGTRTVQITGPRQNPVGQLTLEFLYIRPMRENLCDMSRSYTKYWNTKRDPIDIGHRGMGSTKPREAAIPENTISSFNTAGEHGADYVEFDVQLCKDLNVVVYHDFKVCLTLKKKKQSGHEFHESAVKDLTLEQLQRLRLDHADVLTEGSGVCPNDESDPDHPEDWQMFPTLQQVFERVDPLIGFDIEIKYPMALANGKHEMEHFFDQNLYVDNILDSVLRHAGSRRVMLTCFDPDICSILGAKQRIYPVIFSCMGRNDLWVPYGDLRAREYMYSLYYSIFDGIMGISAFYDELVKNMEMFTKIKDEGLLLFVWGALNDRDTIKRVKQLGVDGLIYDKINQLKGTPNIFHLEKQAKLEQTGLTNGVGDENGLMTS